MIRNYGPIKTILISLGIVLGLWLLIFLVDCFKVVITISPPIFATKVEECTLDYDRVDDENPTNTPQQKVCHYKGLGYEIRLQRASENYKVKLGTPYHYYEIRIFNKIVDEYLLI